jgi:hypothetical protein
MARAVRWDLIADPRRFQRGFREAERTSDRLGKTVRRTASLIGGAFAAVQVAGFLKGAIDEAREAQKVGRQTAAVIKATGGVAKVSAKDVDRLSTALSNKVAVDDEIIQAGANMLLTFKNVRNEVGKGNNVFDQASSAILDMTAAMHQGEVTQQGLEKASIQVGKALNDPIKGITALTRVGVTFTQGQKDQIKALVEAGRVQDAQRIILKELRTEFGGAAVAAADSGKRLAVVWANIKERVGKLLLPALDSAAGFITGKLIPAAERFWKQAGPGFGDAIGDAAAKVALFFSGLRDNLGPQLDRVKHAWQENSQAILDFVGSLTGGQDKMVSGADAARSLGDALVKLTESAGTAARAGDQISAWLNRQNTQLDDSGAKIHDKLIAPISKATLKFGEFFGLRPIGPLQGVAERLTSTTAELAGNTSDAATAAQRHATAMRQQKSAMDALSGSLDDEKNAELNLRQAKLNVSTAQGRLNELKKTGKTRSVEYKQAQLNLERAHLAAKEASTLYRAAVNKSNEAERVAASRAAAVSSALRTLQGTSLGARKRLVQFALDGSAAIRKLKSHTVKVTANYNIGAPKGIELLIEKGLVRRARGGPISGPGTSTSDSIPVWLSSGEHVWSAEEVQGAGGHQEMTQMRKRARGMAAGGPVLDFKQTGTSAFLARPGRFDANIARSLNAAARGFAALVRANKDAIFGIGKPAVKRFIQSTDPLPYIWGGAGPGGYDCSGLVSAVLGKHTGAGGGRGQRYFTTSSIRAGILGIKPGRGGTLEIGVTAGTGHMAGRYGGLGFEAESTRTGIKVGSAASRPESFARHFHLAKGGVVDERMLARFAQLTGADIGGDQGRLRVNGMAFAKGGYLNPRTFSYAKHLLQRIRSGARVYEDFTWRGMPRSYGRWNDEVQRRVFANLTGGYDFPRDLKKVGPILGSLIHRSAYRARAFDQGGWRLTAQQLNRLPDAARWTYVGAHGLPTPPKGFAWAEDHSLVRSNFWNAKGGIFTRPTIIGVGERGPEAVIPLGRGGGGNRELARMIAEELAKVIPTTISVDNVHTGLLAKKRGQGRIKLGLE